MRVYVCMSVTIYIHIYIYMFVYYIYVYTCIDGIDRYIHLAEYDISVHSTGCMQLPFSPAIHGFCRVSSFRCVCL